MQTIYLDNAATTFPKPPEVIKAVTDCLNNYAVNPRRGHNALVQQANNCIEGARVSLATLFSARPDQLVFVPSATFGINLVMQGVSLKRGDCIYVSPFEHNAVVRCAEHLTRTRGVEWRQMPLDRELNLDVEEMRRSFEYNPPSLVVVTHASNVTGDILPIKPIVDVSHRYGAKVLVDAAQTAGCYSPSLTEYDYDYLTFSSHKGLYGIPGAGGVVIKNPQQELIPILYGGTGVSSEDIEMPRTGVERFEAGTAPLPAIVSMAAGVQWLQAVGMDRIRAKNDSLRSLLVSMLQDMPGVEIHKSSMAANVGTIAFATSMYTPQELNMALDLKGICVRSGLHCAPLAHKALGTFPQGSVRVSFSWFSEEGQVRSLVALLHELLN